MQAQLYLPAWVPTKWTRLFTQPWEGDVTIVLPWKLYSSSIGKAIRNPTSADLVHADQEGKKATWCHLSAIQVRALSTLHPSCQYWHTHWHTRQVTTHAAIHISP